jgi:hypothetical protein
VSEPSHGDLTTSTCRRYRRRWCLPCCRRTWTS